MKITATETEEAAKLLAQSAHKRLEEVCGPTESRPWTEMTPIARAAFREAARGFAAMVKESRDDRDIAVIMHLDWMGDPRNPPDELGIGA
jgi:hypothetical protein